MDLIEHTLTVGLLWSAVPTVILLVCLRWGRYAFVDDYPEDIRALMGEFGRAERIRGWVLGPLFMATLLGALIVTTWLWLRGDAGRGLLDAYVAAIAVLVLFCLIDLVFVDWLVICWWRPGWVVIPGTESAAGWGDYAYHLKVQLTGKGLVVLVVLPVVIAGVALLLPR